MKFARHLAAATLAVAAVVVLGLAWNRFGASTLVATERAPFKHIAARDLRLKGAPPGEIAVLPGGHGRHAIRIFRSGPMSLGLGSMLDSVSWPYLRRTVTIEAAVIAGVIVADIGRRRLRIRRRRRRRSCR